MSYQCLDRQMSSLQIFIRVRNEIFKRNIENKRDLKKKNWCKFAKCILRIPCMYQKFSL